MTHIVVALLAIATGFSIGHRTARIVHIPIGGTRAQDEAALNAPVTDEGLGRMRDAVYALNCACCELWWTSCGEEHAETCDHRSTP